MPWIRSNEYKSHLPTPMFRVISNKRFTPVFWPCTMHNSKRFLSEKRPLAELPVTLRTFGMASDRIELPTRGFSVLMLYRDYVSHRSLLVSKKEHLIAIIPDLSQAFLFLEEARTLPPLKGQAALRDRLVASRTVNKFSATRISYIKRSSAELSLNLLYDFELWPVVLIYSEIGGALFFASQRGSWLPGYEAGE